ncbi:hypothetical protein [Streptomyces sp. RTd22]|uniref:hypothetical protein n=1 Tax=Streptomyces sp. RTd22 TaxID=1841249 RepID=UPI0007C48296|nr:hypothetical protein [Streptomyces sp. RTd22]
MKSRIEKETGMPVPADPSEVPQHTDDCPAGCAGEGYQTYVGRSTGFEFAVRPCDGSPDTSSPYYRD